jgi:hypothetical protein
VEALPVEEPDPEPVTPPILTIQIIPIQINYLVVSTLAGLDHNLVNDVVTEKDVDDPPVYEALRLIRVVAMLEALQSRQIMNKYRYIYTKYIASIKKNPNTLFLFIYVLMYILYSIYIL